MNVTGSTNLPTGARVAILSASLLLGSFLAEAQEKLYWVDTGAGTIQRADVGGSNLETLVSGQTTNMLGLDINPNNGRIYWATGNDGTIDTADSDGSNVQTLVSGLGRPICVRLDVISGKMYWTDQDTGLIQRADLDGSNIETLFSGAIGLVGLDLDLINGKMYWSNAGTSEINRADLDGSNVENIVSGVFSPLKLVVDPAAGFVYAANFGPGEITRYDLDGSNPTSIVTGIEPEGITLIDSTSRALDGVVWTDQFAGTINIAPIGGGSPTVIVSGLISPEGIRYTGLLVGLAPSLPASNTWSLLLTIVSIVFVASTVLAFQSWRRRI